MTLPRLSLQVLEAFEVVARLGSMKRAAQEMGVSISSVSHHVARLEEELGVDLIDRSARPFALTAEGRQALHHLTNGLNHLRRATSETAVSGLLGVRSLRIGIVEDFESSIAPELAVLLARRMPGASLSIRNILSHEASELVLRGKLDLALAAEDPISTSGVACNPLIADPFVAAVPVDLAAVLSDMLRGRSDLPLLRFNKDHLIGRQVETHLSRNRIALPDRYSFDSAQSIMAVIANGDGWAILTPLGFLRAQRYAAQVELHPLTLPAFSRRISLMSRPDFDPPMVRAIATLLRQSIDRLAVAPIVTSYPWLADAFVLLEQDA